MWTSPLAKGGPSCKTKSGVVFSRFLNLLVDFLGVPAGQNFRFPSGEIGLHREVRPRQIQCLFVVHSKDTETNIKWIDRKELQEAGAGIGQPEPVKGEDSEVRKALRAAYGRSDSRIARADSLALAF